MKLFSMETRFSTDGKPSLSPEINQSIAWLQNTIIRLERQRNRAFRSLFFYRIAFWWLLALVVGYLISGTVMEVW